MMNRQRQQWVSALFETAESIFPEIRAARARTKREAFYSGYRRLVEIELHGWNRLRHAPGGLEWLRREYPLILWRIGQRALQLCPEWAADPPDFLLPILVAPGIEADLERVGRQPRT